MPNEWPQLQLGELRISTCDRDNHRRALQELKLWRYAGTTIVPRLGMADPVLIDILGDGYLYRGKDPARGHLRRGVDLDHPAEEVARRADAHAIRRHALYLDPLPAPWMPKVQSHASAYPRRAAMKIITISPTLLRAPGIGERVLPLPAGHYGVEHRGELAAINELQTNEVVFQGPGPAEVAVSRAQF